MVLLPGFTQAVNNFMTEYKMFIGGFLGVVTLVVFGLFIYNIALLGGSGIFAERTSVKKREQAIKGVFIALISLAVLGSLDFVYFLFIKTVL